MVYEHSERFINPLSHDEVVHGKRSLLEKMPGDLWQKFANLRTLLAYQMTRPGKILLFMGTELAPFREWHHDVGLDWELAKEPRRQELAHLMRTLLRMYREQPCFYRRDPDPEGFQWIEGGDRDNSVLVYVRLAGSQHVIVALNLTPVPRPGYRFGTPAPGAYHELLSTDAAEFGGSGSATRQPVKTEPIEWNGRPQSVVVDLPPLAALVLIPGD
jgi:1,4-alpha-glucan branching enzyme